MCILISAALVYSWTGVEMNLLVAGPGFVNRIGNTVGTDFGAFYAAGVQAREGRAADLYDGVSLRATHERLMGRPVKDYPWAYPPPILLGLGALSLLPFVPALWTWLGLTLTLIVLAVMAICRRPAATAVVLLFPAVTQAAITGPTGTLTGALFASGFACLVRWPVLAGLSLALLVYKPHLAILVPVCLLAGREWRVLAAFSAGLLLLAIGSAMAFGVRVWAGFLAGATGHMHYIAGGSFPWTRMPTVFVAVLHATGDERVAAVAQAASFVAVTFACIRVWTVSSDAFTRSLVLGSGAFLATPYAFDYDTTLLVAPFACLLRHRDDVPLTTAAFGVLVAMWVAPLVVWLGSTWFGQQLGPILFAALVAHAVVEAERDRTPQA